MEINKPQFVFNSFFILREFTGLHTNNLLLIKLNVVTRQVRPIFKGQNQNKYIFVYKHQKQE